MAGIVLLSTFGQIMAPFAPSCDRWPATVMMIMLMMIIITLRAPTSRLRPFGSTLGPSGLLDNVIDGQKDDGDHHLRNF